MAYNYITLDDESLHDDTPNSKRIVDRTQGLQGIAPIRSVKRVRPGADGGINTSKWEDAAALVVEGQIAGNTHLEMFNEWDQVKAAMRRAKDDTVLLKWQRGEPDPREGATNLITNPSFEVDTAGWDELAGSADWASRSFVRSSEWAQFGDFSNKMTGTKDGTASLAVSNMSRPAGVNGDPVVAGRTYTFSAYVNLIDAPTGASAQFKPRIAWWTAAGALVAVTSGTTDLTLGERRVSLTAVAPATAAFASVQLNVETAAPDDVVTYHADAILLEETSTLHDYFDGDTPGAQWDGTEHASTSTFIAAPGSILQRAVKLDGEVPDPVEGIGTILRYQAMFNSPDPLAYSQTLQVITGDALTGGGGGLTFPMTFPFTFSGSSGGGATVTNGGTEPTPPIFRVHGFITAPQIVLGTDRIVMTGEVQNGQYLEIDVQEETIKLGGTVDRASQLDEDASTFFRLPVGESTPRLVGGSFDGSAHLEVRFRDAY